jgi:hypothetical protein
MSITYTTFLTESLPGGQTRTYRGYAIGNGIIFNALATLTVGGQTIPILDYELFIPNMTLAHFSGLSWSVMDTYDWGLGQKRYVRQRVINALVFPFGPLGTLTEVLRTTQQQIPNAVEMITNMQVNWAPV